MSTLVIDPPVFNRILNTLYFEVYGRSKYVLSYKPWKDIVVRAPEPDACKLYEIQQVERFVKWMYWANLRSYIVRYRHMGIKSGYRANKCFEPEYPKDTSQFTDVELYKQLQCIRYNIDFKSGWTKRLDKFIGAVAHRIIQDLPEYDKAGWGQIK